MSGGVLFDLWALAFGAVCAGIIGLICVLTARHPKPYDWQKDGECDNRSHVRVLP